MASIQRQNGGGANQITTKSQMATQAKAVSSDAYFKPQQGTAVDSAKRSTRNGKGGLEPRFLVLTDVDTEFAKYYHVDITNRRHFPDDQAGIASYEERRQWEIGAVVCLLWPNSRMKLVRSLAEIVKIFDNEHDAKETVVELDKIATENSRLEKERMGGCPVDDGNAVGQFEQGVNGDGDEFMRSPMSQQSGDANDEPEAGDESGEANDEAEAGDGQEGGEAGTRFGINQSLKDYIDQKVDMSNQRIHDKYIPVLNDQADEIKRLHAQLKKLHASSNGKETVRSRTHKRPALPALITDDEVESFPKWMNNNVVSIVNEIYLMAPDPKHCFTTLAKEMWGDDLFAFIYKSKPKEKTENGEEREEEEKEKEDEKDEIPGVRRLSLNDRDPTGLEVYKKAADVYFTKIVLPESKLQHERQRQAALAAIQAGKSDVYAPPPFGIADEYSARAIFVHAKMLSLNDVGNDTYRREKIENTKFRKLIELGHRPTKDFDLESDKALKEPFLERLVVKRQQWKDKERLKSQEKKAKKAKKRKVADVSIV